MPNTSNFFRAALAALILATPFGARSFAADAAAAAPAPGAGVPSTRVTFAPGIDPKELTELKWADVDVLSAISYLEALTGKIVIRPQGLPQVQFAVYSKERLTRAEALVAVESVFAINGLALAPLGDKFIKLVATGQIRSEAPELVVGSLRDDPPSGKVVSKLFRLQYLDPTSFQSQIAPFLSSFGFVVPFQNSNTVIVTDTVSNLQRLEYLVTEVDRRLNIETKFYTLHYASATELAQTIKAMLDSARAGLTQGRAQGNVVAGQPVNVPAMQQQGGGAAAGNALQAVLSSSTSINADARTNQLIIITDPANLPFFDNLIEKLDIGADPVTSIEVFAMNYAKATDVAGILTQVAGGRSTTGATTTGSAASRRTTGQTGTTGANRTLNPNQRNIGTNTGLQGANSQNPNLAAQRAQNAQNVLNAEAAGTQFSETLSIVPDDRTNSIIVSGTNSDLEIIRKVIDKLDIVLAQVRIEVVIAEVTLTKDLVRGIDAFNGTWDQATHKFTANINPGSGANSLAGPFGAAVGGVLSGGSITGLTLNTVFSSARTNSNVNLLSVPTIVTTHNQPASILVGERRPIPSTTTLGGTNTVQNSINYVDVPLQLDVTPVIGPNNVVQLEIHQTVDAVTDFVLIGSDRIPVVSSREATSYISVKDGQLIVLGGLQKTFNSRTKTRMFFLGEIPLLGELFSRTNNQSTRTELLLFLKPTVLRNTDEADANARESVNKLTGNPEDLGLVNEITGEHVGEKPELPAERPVVHGRP